MASLQCLSMAFVSFNPLRGKTEYPVYISHSFLRLSKSLWVAARGLRIVKRLSRAVKKSVPRPPTPCWGTLCPGCFSVKAPVSSNIFSITSPFTMVLLHYRKQTRDQPKVKIWVQSSQEFQANCGGLLDWVSSGSAGRSMPLSSLAHLVLVHFREEWSKMLGNRQKGAMYIGT